MARDVILAQIPDANITLRRTSGGVFEVTVDGQLRFSKKALGRFPTEEEVAALAVA